MNINWVCKHRIPTSNGPTISVSLETVEVWSDEEWCGLMQWLEESLFLLYGTFDVFLSVFAPTKAIVMMKLT